MKRIKESISKMIYPDKSFYRLVWGLALPIACQNLITIGVNITDTMMMGALGETQLSAASLATQFVNMFQTFVMGLSMGASVLSARYWGMKQKQSLRKTIAVMLRLVLAVACIFAAITFFAPDWVMRMYTTDQTIIDEGVRYLKFAVFTYFLHGLSLGCTIIMRSVQKVKLPLYVSLGAFLLNIVGNYVLMFGKLGLPAMGIAGASLATLLVRIFECALNCGYLLFWDKDIGFRPWHFFMKTRDLLPEYIRISIPVLISDGFLAVGSNAVMMIVGRMGESFVAANAVVSVTERLCITGIMGVSQASAMITGKTLGEGKEEEVQRQGYAFLGIGVFFGAIAAVVILLLSQPVINIYHLQPGTAEIALQLFFATAISALFQATSGLLTKGTLRGGGDTRVLMIADSIFLWLVSVPLGYFAGIVLGMPPFWVYFFLKAENYCKTIWAVKRLKSGKWIHKIKAYE